MSAERLPSPPQAMIVFVGERAGTRAQQAVEKAADHLDAALGHLDDWGSREAVRRCVRRAANALAGAKYATETEKTK